MTKDELIKSAKENFNVSLNPKDKLKDLELQYASIESTVGVEEEVVVESNSKDPIASRGEHGKILPWSPLHRSDFWTFIYDKGSLTKEEKEKLGL
jgi:hypothetical protein